MIPKINNRYQAVAVHLIVSIPFMVGMLYLVLTRWQPEPYLTADGGWIMLGVLALTFIGAGPLLTLMIYKPGKKGLVFDLVVIAIVQSFVLCYGAYKFYQERPVLLVFAIDRFTLVSSNDVNLSELKKVKSRAKAGSGHEYATRGPLMVFAKLPESDAERTSLLKDVMKGEPDLEFRPARYRDYYSNLDTVLQRSFDLGTLSQRSTVNREKIAAFNSDHCVTTGECAYFPLIGKARDMMLVIKRDDGSVIGAIDINPWGT